MTIGFRVFEKRPMPEKSLVERFRALAAAPVADCMGRSSAMAATIRRLTPFKGVCMAGAALTVKARPGDNLIIHKALDLAQAGDIIVVSNAGSQERALMGEVMYGYSVSKGIEGLVLDGPIRDIDSLSHLPLTVYATGSTPAGPSKDGPGEVNVPISCGNIVVHPGDIILGDADGVIVIPLLDAQELIDTAEAFMAKDTAKTANALRGALDRSWVNKSLESKGCALIDDTWYGLTK